MTLCALAISPTAASAAPLADEETTPDGVTSIQLETALPAVPAELMEWASDTQNNLSNLDSFSTVRLSDDRTGAEIFWHGEETDELQSALAEASGDFWVEVQQTKYEPGILREEALKLLEAGSLEGAEITSTWANPDGSGISATVAPGVGAQKRGEGTTEINGVPLTVTVEGLEPAAGRLNDNYHFGGSRLINATQGNGCSLGFAVALPNSPSTNGGMFAAHCTDINDQWVRPSDVSGQYFTMGTATAKVNSRDGAILTGTFYSPGVYIGSYTSDAFVYITGIANPVQNTEICYSGSYSGTSCGNLVAVPTYNYSLTGVGNITGVRTAQTQGYPAAGNGDSGGPGVVPVSAPGGGAYIWAGTIISAIPTNNSSTNCQGVPGSSATNGRKCSHIVASTKASEIASNAGWAIRVDAPIFVNSRSHRFSG